MSIASATIYILSESFVVRIVTSRSPRKTTIRVQPGFGISGERVIITTP